MRFLLCAQPIIGHIEPGLVIADALRERGHEVAWYTGTCQHERLAARGYRVFPVKKGFDYDGADPNAYFPARRGLTGTADLRFIIKHVFSDAMPLQAEDIEDALADFPADVLVADFVTYGPLVVSARRAIPWAAYGFSALPLSSVDTAPYGLGLLPDASAGGRLRNRVLNALLKRVLFRDVVRHHDRMLEAAGLRAAGHGPTDMALSPYLLLQGTVPEFEYPRSDLAPQVHFVGPLLPKPRPGGHPLPEWWKDELARGRPRVVVTQGTLDNKDLSELLLPVLQALRNEDLLVVAITGRATAPGELGWLPDNARVVEFIPYQHLLPQVDAFVSNAGYNGVLTALANGVPLVVRGSYSDKPEICARVRWSGAGVHLRGRLREEAVRAAVRRVLSEPSYRGRARDLQARIAAHAPGPASAALLERLAETKRPVERQGSAA
jgi:MGT family glycosyltransferase